MVGDLLDYLAGVVILAAAIGKYRSIRPARPAPAQRHQLIMLVAFAPAHVLSMPSTQAATAAIDPMPFATAFVSHALAMIGANSVVLMLAHALGDPVGWVIRIGRRVVIGLLVVALLAMATLSLASDAQAGNQFVAVAAQHPALVAYYVIFSAFITCCATRMILLLRRFLSRPIDPMMRWGMRAVVVGAGGGVLYCAWTVFAMFDSNSGRVVTQYAWTVAQLVGAGTLLFMAVGSTLSVIAPWLSSWIRRRRVRRALCQLTPLWRRLVATLPDVAFHQAEVVAPEDVLYRRVIEILDAQIRLSEYIPPVVHAAVVAGVGEREGSDVRRAVRAEAALLAVAIDAYRAGCPPTASPAVTHRADDTPDVLFEARRLIAVDIAMREDPVVARITRASRDYLAAVAPRTPSGQRRRGVMAEHRVPARTVVPQRLCWLASPWIRTATSLCWFGFGWWVVMRGIGQ